MKGHIVFLSLMIMFSNFLHSQSLSSDITFDERVYNFGNILEKNGKVTHSFTFQNKGKNTVVIDQVYSDCGCVGKMLSNKSIKPGEKGTVTISYNPAYKSGFFSKEIAVFFNNGKSFAHFWVEGSVVPYEHPIQENYPYYFGRGLYLRLKVMAFGYMKSGETRQMELHYANSTDKTMILKFASDDNISGLKYINPGKVKHKKSGVVTFYYTMPKTNDDILLNLHPYVNGEKLKETLEVKILNQHKIKR